MCVSNLSQSLDTIECEKNSSKSLFNISQSLNQILNTNISLSSNIENTIVSQLTIVASKYASILITDNKIIKAINSSISSDNQWDPISPLLSSIYKDLEKQVKINF